MASSSSSSSSLLRKLCHSAAVLLAPGQADATALDAARRILGREASVADEPAHEPLLGWVGEARLVLLERVQSCLLGANESNSAEEMPLLSMSERVDLRKLMDAALVDLGGWTAALIASGGEVRRVGEDEGCRALESAARRLGGIALPPDEAERLEREATSGGNGPSSAHPSAAIAGARGQPSFLTAHLRTTSALIPLMTASLLLGWAPAPGPAGYAHLRRTVLLLLRALPPAEGFAVLGGVSRLVSAPASRGKQASAEGLARSWPAHVGRTAQALMARQLAAPGGIRGLMLNLFGAEVGRNDVPDPAKIDHLGTLVSRPPPGMPPAEYWADTAAQLRQIIAPPPKERASPDQFVHAACQIAVRLLTGRMAVEDFAKAFLRGPHAAFALDRRGDTGLEDDPDVDTVTPPSVLVSSSQVTDALALVLPLLTHAPPSFELLSLVLVPILPQLLALHLAISRDPGRSDLERVQADLQAVLRSWARTVEVQEGARLLARCLTSGRGWGDRKGARETFWGRDLEQLETGVPYAVFWGIPARNGVLRPRQSAKTHPAINIRPDALDGASDDDAELRALGQLDLEPDPDAFVQVLATLDQPQLVATFLVNVLGMYQTAVQHQGSPRETLLYLRVIMGICETQSAAVFEQPQHILVFVEEALRGDDIAAQPATSNHVSASDQERDPDSDDEEELEPGMTVREQDASQMGLIETAMSLFAAVVAGNEALDLEQLPLVLPIERHLKRLVKNADAGIRQGASQALMLLAVRKASSTKATLPAVGQLSQTKQDYQEALKLLRDPLLPVRAHGLILLQDVVKAKDFARALVPGILDVFMRSIEDEDSFMYLNAVKGLSSMVDGIGADVFKQLVSAYAEGLSSGPAIQEQGLDRRLRIGEALLQSVKRSGKAFGGYANIVVPPLNRIFPSSHLPTVLRSSALSILVACIEADWRAMLGWTNDLVQGCVDLVQLETVPIIRERKVPLLEDNQGRTQLREPTKSNDSKHPALKRAALVFLGTLFDNVARSQLEEAELAAPRQAGELNLQTLRINQDITARPRPRQAHTVPAHVVWRARTVVQYAADTDEDDLVRHQAGEVLQILDALELSALGISS